VTGFPHSCGHHYAFLIRSSYPKPRCGQLTRLVLILRKPLGFPPFLSTKGTPTRRTMLAKRGSLRRVLNRASTPIKGIQPLCLKPGCVGKKQYLS